MRILPNSPKQYSCVVLRIIQPDGDVKKEISACSIPHWRSAAGLGVWGLYRPAAS